MLNEKWQCPVCFENDCDVRIIEHLDPYGTGDSPTEYEVITKCCGVDAADINTYCKCGSMVYDDGQCLDCYVEQDEQDKQAGTMKVLGMTVAELLKAGARVDVNLHDVDEETGVSFVKEMTGREGREYGFDEFKSYSYLDEHISVSTYITRSSEDEQLETTCGL